MFKPKVIRVDGIFFKAKKPSQLRKWYKDHLSFEMQITLKRFSIFCGLFSKMIQITFRPQPKSLWLIFEWKTSKKR